MVAVAVAQQVMQEVAALVQTGTDALLLVPAGVVVVAVVEHAPLVVALAAAVLVCTGKALVARLVVLAAIQPAKAVLVARTAETMEVLVYSAVLVALLVAELAELQEQAAAQPAATSAQMVQSALFGPVTLVPSHQLARAYPNF
jgi:hypothetical protein